MEEQQKDGVLAWFVFNCVNRYWQEMTPWLQNLYMSGFCQLFMMDVHLVRNTLNKFERRILETMMNKWKFHCISRVCSTIFMFLYVPSKFLTHLQSSCTNLWHATKCIKLILPCFFLDIYGSHYVAYIRDFIFTVSANLLGNSMDSHAHGNKLW